MQQVKCVDASLKTIGYFEMRRRRSFKLSYWLDLQPYSCKQKRHFSALLATWTCPMH